MGLQNFAEARVSGNAVGQKAGSLCFWLIVRWGLAGKSIFAVKGLGYLALPSNSPPAANEPD